MAESASLILLLRDQCKLISVLKKYIDPMLEKSVDPILYKLCSLIKQIKVEAPLLVDMTNPCTLVWKMLTGPLISFQYSRKRSENGERRRK